MNEYETKIKKFVEKNNPGFKKMIYVGEYCPKYIDRSLNIKRSAKAKGRIKIKDKDFETDYKIEILDDENKKNTCLSLSSMTHNSSGYIDRTIIDGLIDFNEGLAKHLHLGRISSNVMNGYRIKEEVEAYDQKGYKSAYGAFVIKWKRLD